MADLAPGDRVTIGGTHEVLIDGERAWIKVEINSAVQDGESSKDALARVGVIIENNIVAEIERQAEVIMRANAKQR